MAKTIFGKNHIWQKPYLAKTIFGKNHIWQKTRTKANIAKGKMSRAITSYHLIIATLKAQIQT